MNKILLSGILLSQFVFASQTLNYPIEFGTGTRGNQAVDEWEEVPGLPRIPRTTKRILLPYGKKLKSISFKDQREQRNFVNLELAVTKIPKPLCNVNVEVAMNREFNEGEVYPGNILGKTQVIEKHGYRIAYVPLYPVQYYPKSHEAIVSQRGNLEVEMEDGEPDALYRGLEEDRADVLPLVDSTEFLNTYPVHQTRQDAQYLVIGTSDLLADGNTTGLTSFLAEKNQRGITTATLTTEDIAGTFTGSSTQEKIRNAIKKYYKENGTKYVLLIGNGYSSTPSKSLSTNQGSVLADYYYACLNGSFQSGSTDTACEVAVGRFPATTQEDLKVIIEKTNKMASLSASDPRVQNGLLFGEVLDSSTYASRTVEQLAVGGKTGSTKTQGFPSTAKFTKLYETSNETFSSSDVIDAINAGNFYTVNHMGHANQTYCMRFKSSAISGFTNTLPFFGITEGCHPGDIHGSNWTASLMTFPSGGAGAMISNSGFGWYNPGSPDGPSAKQHVLFYDTVFKEGVRELGKIHYRAKERMIPDMKQTLVRYVAYETNLFGDPEMKLKF